MANEKIMETLIVPFSKAINQNKPASIEMQGYKLKQIRTIDNVFVYEKLVDIVREPNRVTVKLKDHGAKFRVDEFIEAGYKIIEYALLGDNGFILLEKKHKHIKVGL